MTSENERFRPARDDRNVQLLVYRIRVPERERPSIVHPGRVSMKANQHEVLGNEAKQDVRPARDDRNVQPLVYRIRVPERERRRSYPGRAGFSERQPSTKCWELRRNKMSVPRQGQSKCSAPGLWIRVGTPSIVQSGTGVLNANPARRTGLLSFRPSGTTSAGACAFREAIVISIGGNVNSSRQ